jgi:hypothetical protein
MEMEMEIELEIEILQILKKRRLRLAGFSTGTLVITRQ